jgi:ribosomal protein RSM22 (predicted rRNA methylase)
MEALTAADWQRLRALRDRFLTDASDDYWTPRDLTLYDATFAPRIGWKWNAALASLERAGWKPRSTRLLDWGCGTGIAARTVATWTSLRAAEVFDQSPLAAAFARDRLNAAGIPTNVRPPSTAIEPGTLLLLSHVVGELTSDELSSLAAFAATADEVLWVEPGSRDISRRLSGVREALLAAGHQLLAPCTHQRSCPMLASENERHWCHFFAKPPTEVFQSPFWREVSLRLGIDLRALPYSFLATSRVSSPAWPENAERLIGHPRELKAHCKLLCCGAGGLAERTLQRRDAPDLFRQITKRQADGVFAWQENPDKPGQIAGGEIVS